MADAGPNLLFIYTDEQAFNTLAAYGNTRIHMPNLNRLADESTVFDEAYVTQPVCTPSRSSLLTGLYPHANGCVENNIPLRKDTACLPEMIGGDRYVTAHFGKWHLGDELFAQHGFREWISIEDCYNKWFTEGRDRNIRSSYHDFLVKNRFAPVNGDRFGRAEAARLPEEFGKPAFLAREAAKFLSEHKNTPFILYVNFLEPHMPFFGPRDDQYNIDEIPLPPNFDDIPGARSPLKCRLLQKHYERNGVSNIGLDTEKGWRRLIANYWGLCSLVDTWAGVILDALRETGQWDNTIIVFTSDHGDMMGAHRLAAKCVMYQEAVRVPLMIKPSGRTCSPRVMGPVSQVDVVPTLLDLMGEPCRSGLHGKSLCPWMEDAGQKHEESVFIEWNGSDIALRADSDAAWPNGRARDRSEAGRLRAAMDDQVRTIITSDGWKFNCGMNGEHELYNIRTDPGETVNLFLDKREFSVGLRRDIVSWQRRTGDKVSLPKIG